MVFTGEKIEQLNCERLRQIQPELAGKVLKLLALAEKENHSLLITQGFRSFAEQNRLYAQGRRLPGKIVTNARGGESKHNFGKAVDFAFVVGGEISWQESLYRKIGVWAREVGLKWGGDWKTFKDLPHVEI